MTLSNKNSFGTALMDSFKQNIRQYTMIAALLGIWIIFSILTNGVFINPRNLSNLFLQTATVAIIAIGMTLIIVTGHIDLSVGSVAGFCGAIAALVQVKLGMGTIPAIMAGLLTGLAIGTWQGYWIAYRKVPAFIVTLAGMLIFRGAIVGITGGQTIGPMNNSFKAIGQEYLPRLIFKTAPFHDTSLILTIIMIGFMVMIMVRQRKSRLRYGFTVLPKQLQIIKILLLAVSVGAVGYIMIAYNGISYAVLIVLALAALFHFLSTNTVFGRHLFAIGGNKEAARLSGINIRQKTMFLFMIMGVLTSIAGIVFTARLNAATTSAGNLFELDAIAAAVIGGTSLSGGEGTIIGAIVGALIMASLDNGMSLMNMDVTWQYIIKGMILILAVYVDIITRKADQK